MRNFRLIVAVSLMIVLLGAVVTFAQIAQPGLINYQGKLADSEGELVTDTLSFTFSIYDVASGGTPLWTETHPAVFVWGGIYDVLLGSVTPVPEAIFWDPVPGSNGIRRAGDRWLQVQVGPSCTIEPRQRLAAVAYAIHADVVDGRHATEFVSSVHPDTMEGLEWCSDDTTTLTVTNECDGGGLRGECLTDIGVKGFGVTGVLGLATQAGDTALYGRAFNPAVLAGYFNGNLLVNGDMQMGMNVADPYHYLRISGGNAWGYLYAPGPADERAMNLSFNYHKASTGHVYDNTSIGSATSQIRVGNGTLRFYTSRLTTVAGIVEEPQLRLSVLPSGQTVFAGPLEVQGHAQFCTLTVGDIAQIDDSLRIDGSLGIGTPAPTDCKLHVKGTGSLKGNHMALFENTSTSGGDGIAIQVGQDQPSSETRFVSFLNNSGDARGRIEGQTIAEYALNWQYILTNAIFIAKTAYVIASNLRAKEPQMCSGYACPPIISKNVAAAAIAALLAAQKAIYEGWKIGGMLGITYESRHGDYAEWLKRLDADEEIRPGDIVGAFGGQVTKSTKGAQQLLVTSTMPLVAGNMPPEQEEHLYEKTAFMGQVPVNVIGPVQAGDYIIPSGLEDGTGIAISPELMTADEYVQVVGRAWRSSASTRLKQVPVAVGLNSNDVAEIIEKMHRKNHDLGCELDELENRIADLKELNQHVTRLEEAMKRSASTDGTE